MEPGCYRERKSEPGDRSSGAVPQPGSHDGPAEPEIQKIHGLAQLFTRKPPGQGDVRRPGPREGLGDGAADLPVQALVHFAERGGQDNGPGQDIFVPPGCKDLHAREVDAQGKRPLKGVKRRHEEFRPGREREVRPVAGTGMAGKARKAGLGEPHPVGPDGGLGIVVEHQLYAAHPPIMPFRQANRVIPKPKTDADSRSGKAIGERESQLQRALTRSIRSRSLLTLASDAARSAFNSAADWTPFGCGPASPWPVLCSCILAGALLEAKGSWKGLPGVVMPPR